MGLLYLNFFLRFREFLLNLRGLCHHIEKRDETSLKLTHTFFSLVHIVSKHFLALSHELQHFLQLVIRHDSMLPINLAQDNIQCSNNRNYVCDQMTNAESLQRLQIDEAWWPHPHAPRLLRSV